MTKSQLIIIAIILIILIAGTCFKLGFFLGKKSLEDELTEAQRIIDSFLLPATEEIFSINGQIKEIKDNAINLEISSSQLEGPPLPGEDPKKEIIKVIVGEKTKIITTEKIEITLNELKIEDWIYVESEENIKNKKEFTAKSIKLTGQVSGETLLPGGETAPSSPEDEPAPVPEGYIPPSPEEDEPAILP